MHSFHLFWINVHTLTLDFIETVKSSKMVHKFFNFPIYFFPVEDVLEKISEVSQVPQIQETGTLFQDDSKLVDQGNELTQPTTSQVSENQNTENGNVQDGKSIIS